MIEKVDYRWKGSQKERKMSNKEKKRKKEKD